MRIWDISPERLCRQHLLGEHREAHALWTILTRDRKGYSRHPETTRWRGKLKALYIRHDAVAKEMTKRGYKHSSPLARHLATGVAKQNEFVDSYDEQIEILRNKGCGCDLS
jgi:hypothetical protein